MRNPEIEIKKSLNSGSLGITGKERRDEAKLEGEMTFECRAEPLLEGAPCVQAYNLVLAG